MLGVHISQLSSTVSYRTFSIVWYMQYVQGRYRSSINFTYLKGYALLNFPWNNALTCSPCLQILQQKAWDISHSYESHCPLQTINQLLWIILAAKVASDIFIDLQLSIEKFMNMSHFRWAMLAYSSRVLTTMGSRREIHMTYNATIITVSGHSGQKVNMLYSDLYLM